MAPRAMASAYVYKAGLHTVSFTVCSQAAHGAQRAIFGTDVDTGGCSHHSRARWGCLLPADRTTEARNGSSRLGTSASGGDMRHTGHLR